jgi:putative PIN family toxin of toxin-antitoxin system
MLSLTADTNIYISALNFGGQPLRLLDLARAGIVRIDISEPILDEVLRVLRDKFRWDAAMLSEAEDLISGFTRRVAPTKEIDTIKEDPPDNRVLECAEEAASDFIVTGDRHLLRLGNHFAIPIVRVTDLLSTEPPQLHPRR